MGEPALPGPTTALRVCREVVCSERRCYLVQLGRHRDFPETGTSLAVQRLRLRVPTARAWFRSLIRELRSRKPRGVVKKK